MQATQLPRSIAHVGATPLLYSIAPPSPPESETPGSLQRQEPRHSLALPDHLQDTSDKILPETHSHAPNAPRTTPPKASLSLSLSLSLSTTDPSYQHHATNPSPRTTQHSERETPPRLTITGTSLGLERH
ncbi:hypothetical protein M758_7G031300 [Ceratodon purpureus]|nr:hypothetical protein M758_7G031300 [Ceratodon purpureus]